MRRFSKRGGQITKREEEARLDRGRVGEQVEVKQAVLPAAQLVNQQPSVALARVEEPRKKATMSKAPTGKRMQARIGIDESGKGDYFGPLVIGAVSVDAQTEARLSVLGVRDSKRLTDDRMRPMAQAIKECCPQSIVVIAPKRYNELYATIRNLNRLLAWGHARALENLLEQVDCPLAIADQFGDASFLQNALLPKGRHITLQQRPHAEDDLAVAAASILARVAFVQGLEELARQVGHILPKGAVSQSIFTVGRAIVAEAGEPALGSVAKLHFRTTQSILT